MKIVATYDNSFAANLAKGLLEDAGIPSFVLNEHMSMVTGVFNKDLLSIQLTVDDADYEQALKVLAASQSAE